MSATTDIVQKLWNLCHVVRDNESYQYLTSLCNIAAIVLSSRLGNWSSRLALDIRSHGKQLGKFKRHQAHSDQQISPHAATDDRCANFSASTCPTQVLELIASSTADKLPLEKFHRLLDLVFWGRETSKNIHTVSNSL